MIDYKNTLNLPKTQFAMRGNLAIREPIMLKRWHQQDLYQLICQATQGKKTFFLHDGPPYANGSIHIGHSVNKILKDIIIKSKRLMGYCSPYIPGWDCHGLPIELKVEQLIGKPGKKVSASEFIIACRNYASEQVTWQKKDFIRLGVLGDWDNIYRTMDFHTEANIIRTLSKIIENGHVYQGNKPVHWCIDCRSALAEAEVEYYDYTSPSIYVIFAATNTHDVAARFGIPNVLSSISFLVWTTTPWTIPANRAISIHPNLNYQLVKVNQQGFILAADLVTSVLTYLGIQNWTVVKNIKGYVLELLRFSHPFMKFDVPVVLSNHVTINVGTGVVHTSPSHGPDDYLIGREYNLEIVNIVGPDGCYLPGTFSLLDGTSVYQSNQTVISLLKDRGALLHTGTIQHSYPHCWRHKTPLIFRATPQWFISMDKKKLRQQSLKEIKKIQWIPSNSQASITNMVNNRQDWCISRQRIWGVPMSLFVHNHTKKLHPQTSEIMEYVAKQVEKKGIQAWWDLDPIKILGDDIVNYSKINDILDVWFDSGSTHSSVINAQTEFANHEIDMYLEGADQHRGWFMSSLISSTAIKGKAPYKTVITHGFAVDSNGRKMSKSIGNVVSPQQVVDKLGADILRLWVASTNYTDDMTISDEILKRSVDTYRRIRNTARFLLANLNGFEPKQHSVSIDKMIILDQWAIDRAQVAQDEIIAAYNSYEFHSVVQRIMQFCSVEMGSFYLDIIKDRQYTTQYNSIARRSCQTALFHIIEAMVRWIAPIISFTADEIWGFIPGKRSPSVFIEEWYKNLSRLDAEQHMNDTYWNTLLQVRSDVNYLIEQARIKKNIGSSLETQVTLYSEPILAMQLRQLGNELHFVLLTSAVQIADYQEADNNALQSTRIKGLKITLNHATGRKCQRCWHYEQDIGNNTQYPEICGRCVINIAGNGEERKFV
ncbi:isoleucine--tRNA ligase [Candidatus Palibaumannia cicadellinicola]|uniref:Isoleucine--tRNA ligase n=1 Tax=Baumannia cicadellinicola subsp. Homalodisca coagulata TaxID=374463 RepID=SYI_BAUCH|nr:isoleucine--tRNA ligase [Candidatus Baumannia cicadellinicola]Q1LSS9.1 RecName: Full=Isoleucine--tRNA ligase; AltName: Full=Isoleucyl-tRNA synthetase; Short=IleRS [Baumannia cicadellinicola str. Hc (Homalodisca coagulata)]ABF14142.1 isoleucyl-tRNA synthetase [Baumannia cicadellinicola str. Hc (Homalodisca coagulata)]MCJ7462153.1 isoleucine--tRNA ligase [Candidatus Baumannia cicadellinicola]MCJ7462984.1 isoleucine--tRNA ligase [Candidatus Baumannia cicadellinicola]